MAGVSLAISYGDAEMLHSLQGTNVDGWGTLHSCAGRLGQVHEIKSGNLYIGSILIDIDILGDWIILPSSWR
jgi:hypothetical protein